MARRDESSHAKPGDAKPRSVPRHDEHGIVQYELIQPIGEGNFGIVWRAERDGISVAVKEVTRPLDSRETRELLKTLETLKKINHPNILCPENSWTDSGRLYIEMAYADGGSLKDRLLAYQNRGQRGIPGPELLKFFKETAEALDYLHRQTPVILHRDIKPANILLVQGSAKIADFDLLRQVSGDKSATITQGGTLLYLAPEAIASDVASVHTDLFSFAVTYAELRQGSRPFTGNSVGQIYDKIRWEPPELSDIFEPAEKAVLLKALDKDPKNRHSSCCEFFFQLNRVVDFTAAEVIPVLPIEASPAGDAKSTASQGKEGVAPDTVRRTPIFTHQDIVLPPEDGTEKPGISTNADLAKAITERPAGTSSTQPKRVPSGSGPRPPSLPPPEPIAAPEPAPAAVVADDSKRRYRRPKPRRAAPILGALLMLILVVGIAVGLWFVVQFSITESVRKQIKSKAFPEALKTVDDTTPFWLPARDQLRDDIQKAWWQDLSYPESQDIDALKKYLTRLTAFQARISTQPDAAGRAKKAKEALAAAITEKVDEYLTERKVDEAYALLEENSSHLGDMNTELRDKINKKRSALTALKTARKRIEGNEFEEAKEALAKATFEDKPDIHSRDALAKQADDGIKSRMARDAELVKTVKDTAQIDPKNACARVKDIEDFRRQHSARARWVESIDDLRQRYCSGGGVRLLIAAAWENLRTNTAVARQKIAAAQSQLNPLDPAIAREFSRELNVLAALVAALEANAGQRDTAVKGLVEQVALSKDLPAPIANKLWDELAYLEERQDYFVYPQIDALESAYAALQNKESGISTVNARILSHFLDRAIKADNSAWQPDEKERGKCLQWCDLIGPSLSPFVLALKAECLIESGATPVQLRTVKTPIDAGWYGRYVTALLKEKEALAEKGASAAKSYARAVEILRDALDERPKPKLNLGRNNRSVALLRSAVSQLRGSKAKNWRDTDTDAARDAIAIYDLIFALRDDIHAAPLVDDLIDCGFAAVTATGKTGKLKELVARIDPNKYGANDRVEAYMQFSRAFRALGTNADLNEAVTCLKSAFAVASNNDALRKSMLKDAKELTDQLRGAAQLQRDVQKYSTAVEIAKSCQALIACWRDLDLESAAEFNRQCVEDKLFAAYFGLSSAEKKNLDLFKGAYFRVCEAETKDQRLDDGFLAPVVAMKVQYAPLQTKLKETETEALAALAAVKARADKAPKDSKWQGWRYDLDSHYGTWLFERFKRENPKERLFSKDEKVRSEIREQLVKMRVYLEDALAVPRSTENDWRLEKRIGWTYYMSCEIPKQYDYSEVAAAKKYLEAALKGIKKANEEDEQKTVDVWLKQLDEILKAKSESSRMVRPSPSEAARLRRHDGDRDSLPFAPRGLTAHAAGPDSNG